MTRIVHVASYLPCSKVSNAALSSYLDTTDQWITERTGIQQRFKASEKETTAYMASEVAKKLVTPKQAKTLDFIIVASFTPQQAMPNIASMVQEAIGATQAFCFDLNAACSGFIYALSVADSLLQSKYQTGIIIGSEKISQIIDPHDRTTAVLFGDGAAGVYVKKSPQQLIEVLKAKGKEKEMLQAGFDTKHPLQMNGRGIFNFVLKEVKENIEETVQKAQLTLEEVDYYLLHQANVRLLRQLAKKLHLSDQRFLTNIAQVGNTSAASLPLLLAQMVDQNILSLDGTTRVLFSGFGGGLTYGSILMKI